MATGPLDVRLEDFVAAWRRPLVAYCRRFLASAPGNLAAYVDEVADETLARLWTKCSEGGDIATLPDEGWKRWTWRVARNLCYDMLRRPQLSPMGSNAMTPLPACGFEHADELERLKPCFDRLRPDDQDLLVFVHFCGAKSTSLCERWQVEPIAVRQRLSRAHQFLLRCMAARPHGGGR